MTDRAHLDMLRDTLARRVTILGSTGSIGASTLDVVAHAREHFGADALGDRELGFIANCAEGPQLFSTSRTGTREALEC